MCLNPTEALQIYFVKTTLKTFLEGLKMFLTYEITASGRVGKRRPRSINGMRGREVLRFIEIRSLITDTDELGGRDGGGGVELL